MQPEGFWHSSVFRWTVFFVGLALVAVIVFLGSVFASGSLDWPMLLLLLDAVVVGVVCGPIFGVVVAIISAIGVLYFIAYPANTWSISNLNDVVSLVVFVAVGVASIALVALVTRARASEARAVARTRLLATVVDTQTTPDVSAALEKIRREFALDRVVLLAPGPISGAREVGSSSGKATPDAHVSIEVELPEGHHLVGYGPELFAEDRGFLEDLAAAAYRAYDTQRLTEEQQRSRLLAEADAARAAVLAAVGHDLRTPLSGLRVALDGLHIDRELLTTEEFDELLDTADRSTRRLDELISNLIDLSRLQAGVLPVSLEPTDVSAVIAQARKDIVSGTVSVHFRDSLPLVYTDGVLLERIVVNLVSNAVRHNPEGTKVEVLTEAAYGWVTISVVDHGPGLNEAERQLVLTGPLPGRQHGDGGSGLGLPIVRQLTAALGGRLAVAETPGGGLTVSVQLPVTPTGASS